MSPLKVRLALEMTSPGSNLVSHGISPYQKQSFHVYTHLSDSVGKPRRTPQFIVPDKVSKISLTRFQAKPIADML